MLSVPQSCVHSTPTRHSPAYCPTSGSSKTIPRHTTATSPFAPTSTTPTCWKSSWHSRIRSRVPMILSPPRKPQKRRRSSSKPSLAGRTSAGHCASSSRTAVGTCLRSSSRVATCFSMITMTWFADCTRKVPAVAAGQANVFKRHMFENLLNSPGFTTNVLDMFHDKPWIGVAVPPLIHISYPTMGHVWFEMTSGPELAEVLDLKVHFDPDTPVGAFGTMFWFRPKALRKLFQHPWQWADFNAEPHHVDGGLAHVLERLICYVAQDARYTTQQILSPHLASWNFAMLEYKVQKCRRRCQIPTSATSVIFSKNGRELAIKRFMRQLRHHLKNKQLPSIYRRPYGRLLAISFICQTLDQLSIAPSRKSCGRFITLADARDMLRRSDL